MNGWTKLHEKAVESVSLSELLDDEPDAFALFILMLAKAGVWGRFPGHPKLLKARVAPMSDRLSAARIAELLPLLRERGFVTAYVGDNEEPLLYTTNHFAYNEKQAWHRVGKPEFPAPPGFDPPADLAEYLSAVAEGRYKGKTLHGECEKFGVVTDKSETTPTDDSHGPLPGSAPKDCSEGSCSTTDVRRTDVQTTENDTNDKIPTAFAAEPQKQREETPAQRAANACLAIWGLTHADLSGQQAGSYYKAMNSLIGQLEHGAEELQAWAADEAGNGKRTLGDGAKPEKAIPSAVRKAVTANSWQAAFAATRGSRPEQPAGRFIANADGSRTYEQHWTAEQRYGVDLAVQCGTWDPDLGIDRLDGRHPDCPREHKIAQGYPA